MITDNDRREWAFHPVTREFLELLAGNRQTTLEAWARSAYVGETIEQTAQANAKALGGVAAYDNILEYLEGLTKDMENENDEAAGS